MSDRGKKTMNQALTPRQAAEAAYKDALLSGSDETQQLARNVLAQRIRCKRLVSVVNDPQRGYRANAIACMRGKASYARYFGIGKAPKPGR